MRNKWTDRQTNISGKIGSY